VRKPIVAGNWKMNKMQADAGQLATAVKSELAGFNGVEVVLCPPFTALVAVVRVLGKGTIGLGAQNCHWEKEGAYTGEVSVDMLKDVGCTHIILGHSERRTYFQETDAQVNRKARVVLAAGLTPIVCVGETLAERDGGTTEAVIKAQVMGSLAGLGDDLRRVVVAYEPVWAIGTGRTATPDQAQAVHAFIRGLLGELGGADVAQAMRIQYGGSMKPSNAAELLGKPDIDGGLIGGAALDAASFVQIVKAARR